jgi:hypothetical protein
METVLRKQEANPLHPSFLKIANNLKPNLVAKISESFSSPLPGGKTCNGFVTDFCPEMTRKSPKSTELDWAETAPKVLIFPYAI